MDMYLCPDILNRRGGNVADAAVAIAAALAVTEPCSTGPGGDAFCLFYNGNTGRLLIFVCVLNSGVDSIVDIINQNGGVMTMDDLSSHESEVITPISTEYKGVRLWEPSPNSQGLTALPLLNILENFPLTAAGHNSSDYIHVLVEAVCLALKDALCYLGDPDHVTIPLETLLDKSYSQQRAQRISMDRATEGVDPGVTTGSDT
ncbi:hypothetical protein L3Q82_025532, partial [Scortum barcoo]